MNNDDELLEQSLARLAAGESMANCLASHPKEAEWLQDALIMAQNLAALPPQQPNPVADQMIHQQLRQRVQQQAASPGFWPARRAANNLEVPMKNLFHLALKWLPRALAAGAVITLIVLFFGQFSDGLPFLSAPPVEPASDVSTIVTDSVPDLAAMLAADPGTAPLYHARLETIPKTPEEALAWAQTFGLPDPAVYHSANPQDTALYVLGSDGGRLTFQQFDGFGDIYYAYPAATMNGGEPYPFDQASDIAITFLRVHNFLPANFLVEKSSGVTGSMQLVIVRPQVEGGVIMGDGPGAALHIGISPDGRVAHASLSRLILEPAGTVPVIPARIAYDNMYLEQYVLGSRRTFLAGGGEPSRTFLPPQPPWEPGQVVDLSGSLNVLLSAATGLPRVELMAAQGHFLLSGARVVELSEQAPWQMMHIQGKISGQEAPDFWIIEVERWQSLPPFAIGASCLKGTLTTSGDEVQFQSEAGNLYDLPNVPTEIDTGARLEVCLVTPAEPGEALAWSSIHQPPRGEGPPAGGMVMDQVAVTVVEAERSESEPGFLAVLTPSPQPAPFFVEPTNPYRIGEEVTLTGRVQFYRIVDSEGEERLEAIFANDGDQGAAMFSYSYPLLAAPELLEEMSEFHNLHVRVYGRIAPAPEPGTFVMMGGNEVAVAVDRFDRPWPEEKVALFLGRLSLEEVAGQEVLLFTDHADGQRYVINPAMASATFFASDPNLQEEKVLLTGVVHPVKTFGGLPLLERLNTVSGSHVNQATEVSQLQQYASQDIPVIQEAQLRQSSPVSSLWEDGTLERVALAYRYQYQPPGHGADGEPYLLEPVWAFFGRSTDGLEEIVVFVQAIVNK